MKTESQARADSTMQAGEDPNVESYTDLNDGSDSDGEISKEEQELLDSIDDAAAFMNVADLVGPNPKPQPEEDADEAENDEETEESDDDQAQADEDETEETEDGEAEEEESEEEQEEEEETTEDETEETNEESDDETEEDETPEPSNTGPKRYRLRSNDPVEQRAFELKRYNRDLSMRECMDRAEKELGKSRESEETDESGSQPTGPQTLADVDAEIAKLEEAYDKASDDLDFDAIKDTQKKLTKLLSQRSDFAARDAVAQITRQQELERIHEQSMNRAVELYPFAADAKSPEVKRMNEIFAELQANEDPLVNDPRLPLKLAQMVAGERGIPPKGRKLVPSEKAKPGDGKPPKKKGTVQPARGNARTTPKAKSGQLDDTIDKISSPHDYEALIHG
jgi:hypothetical protein